MDDDQILEALDDDLEPRSNSDLQQGWIIWSILDIFNNPEEWTEEEANNIFSAAEHYADRWEERYGEDIARGTEWQDGLQ